jgi:hypothetical protein
MNDTTMTLERAVARFVVKFSALDIDEKTRESGTQRLIAHASAANLFLAPTVMNRHPLRYSR